MQIKHFFSLTGYDPKYNGQVTTWEIFCKLLLGKLVHGNMLNESPICVFYTCLVYSSFETCLNFMIRDAKKMMKFLAGTW